MYWTNMMIAESREFNVRPASRSTDVDIACPWRVASQYTTAVAAAAPAKLAAETVENGPIVKVPPNTITTIAPSDAPADTPSVNGVASGFRSKAWKTTPAAARAAPTSAPAITRGSRATNRICASALSAKGIERSSARAMSMWVVPTRGASAPKPAVDQTRRVRTGRYESRRTPAGAVEAAARVFIVDAPLRRHCAGAPPRSGGRPAGAGGCRRPRRTSRARSRWSAWHEWGH